MRVLLDTHMLIYWCSDPTVLSKTQQHAIAQTSEQNPLLVADITLWEIATLAGLGKIELAFPVMEWLNRALAPPLVRVLPITANIAGELSALADWPHRDPADRLIVATARVFGAVVATNDARIRDSGYVHVV